MWKLVIEDDEGKRTIVLLSRSEYTIGRREGSSIRLTERNVSRGHAKLRKVIEQPIHEAERGETRFVLEDTTSYNGVFVNGLRVSHAQPLEHGDLVQIGDYRIVLQDDALTDGASASSDDAHDPSTKDTQPTRASSLLDRPNRLVMLQGPTPGAEFPLTQERLMIGRAEDADIAINHNSVSRLHCEVHALGDSRFELIDKGSSNGVRVNGSDLQRGFVEPGDTIELGDVKFRFVGAGQVFRQESMRFAVVPDRVVERRPVTPRLSSVLPMTVFALVALAGAVGAWVYTRGAKGASKPVPVPVEQVLLLDAKKFCTSEDCEAAHVRVETEIPESSSWRDSQDFKDIESQWAETLLIHAARELDGSAKRSLYQRVAQTMSVDAEHRKLAADCLQELDSSGRAGPAPTELPSSLAKARPDDVANGPEGNRKTAPPAADSATPAPSSPPPSRPAPGSVDDRARQLALVGTPDSKLQLKQELEPRVYAGRASEAEVRLLISTCKDLSDKACVQQARAVLKQQASQP